MIFGVNNSISQAEYTRYSYRQVTHALLEVMGDLKYQLLPSIDHVVGRSGKGGTSDEGLMAYWKAAVFDEA